MIKKIGQWIVLAVLIVIFSSRITAWARQGDVFDDAALLTETEISTLDQEIQDLKEETDWNIYAVTTSDALGMTAMAYADDFFDKQSADKSDGVVFLIDMDHREIYLSTCGEAVRYLTDSRIELILDDAYEYVSDGSYASCFRTMLEGVGKYYKKGITDGQYNYDTETGKRSVYRSLTGGEIAIAILAAAAGGVIVFVSIIARYRLKLGEYRYDYRNFNKVHISRRGDRLVNQTVTHRRIPKQTSAGSSNSGNSSRSSTHTSRSGNSHGGGGRRF